MFKKLTAVAVSLCLMPTAVYALGTSAESSIVINADTRQVLYKDNAYKRLGIASTTKIMTAIIALENGSTDDIMTVSENAQNQEGSSIYLRTGDKILLGDLLYGLMLNSGNDAAVAIAEGIGETTEKFVKMMNDKAQEIGCTNTHFNNPNGLSDPEHYSTAYDMALIMAYAMENDEFRQIVSTKEYQIKNESSVTYLRNHNKLLWQYEGCIGGKTGFTKATGRCLVSCSEREGVRIIAVTLNDRDDWKDHRNLFDYGFENLKKVKVIQKNDILCTRKIRGIKVNLLSNEDFSISLENGKKRDLSCRVYLDEAVNDEIHFGTKLGYADVFVGDYKVGSIELISGQKVNANRASVFRDNINYMLRFVLLNKK
ncbi:MAG: D-alanyl-D-alanine carboxypeptidase [Clostridia bacterium]|nr:D-alanyl-D-alanine carboxypeptidase [Clostridia bacterium]